MRLQTPKPGNIYQKTEMFRGKQGGAGTFGIKEWVDQMKGGFVCKMEGRKQMG